MADGEECDEAGETPTCNEDCTIVRCGDGIINAAAGEECEGSDLSGETCLSLGFDGGNLTCSESCSLDTFQCLGETGQPQLELNVHAIKQFEFSWDPVDFVTYYEIEEMQDLGTSFESIEEISEDTVVSLTMPLHLRNGARYRLSAVGPLSISDFSEVSVDDRLTDGVGYFKASNTSANARFGHAIAIDHDGRTLAVGAPREPSASTETDPDGFSDGSGAVYVFSWDDELADWVQQDFFKPSVSDTYDLFGWSVALSSDGDTLVVSSPYEDSYWNQPVEDNGAPNSGLIHVYRRDEGQWQPDEPFQRVSVDFSQLDEVFGWSVDINGDGNRIIVGAPAHHPTGNVHVFEYDEVESWTEVLNPVWGLIPSDIPGNPECGYSVAISGDGNSLATGCRGYGEAVPGAGSVWVRHLVDDPAWLILQALNRDEYDAFGTSVALSRDGTILAVGAPYEDSAATGVDAKEWYDDSLPDSGAAYVFSRDGSGWIQTYIKAPYPSENDRFGTSVSLNNDGTILTVGAPGESSNATGINSDSQDDTLPESGAVYVYVRNDSDEWTLRSTVKAPNPDPEDQFGWCTALSGDGQTLSVGADLEDSSALGIGGWQDDQSAPDSGAVYLY